MAAEVEDIGPSRGVVIMVVSPVYIRESVKVKRVASREEEAVVTCSTKVAKEAFYGKPVVGWWRN